MYVTIPEKNKVTESRFDLRLETMNYGPLEDMPEPAPDADATTAVPLESTQANTAQVAFHWPDLAALVEVVRGMPWLLAEARSS